MLFSTCVRHCRLYRFGFRTPAAARASSAQQFWPGQVSGTLLKASLLQRIGELGSRPEGSLLICLGLQHDHSSSVRYQLTTGSRHAALALLQIGYAVHGAWRTVVPPQHCLTELQAA